MRFREVSAQDAPEWWRACAPPKRNSPRSHGGHGEKQLDLGGRSGRGLLRGRGGFGSGCLMQEGVSEARRWERRLRAFPVQMERGGTERSSLRTRVQCVWARVIDIELRPKPRRWMPPALDAARRVHPGGCAPGLILVRWTLNRRGCAEPCPDLCRGPS